MVNMYLPTKNTLSKKRSTKDLFDDVYAFLFLIVFTKTYAVGTQVDAIQMGTHNICLYKEEDKKYAGSNLNTTELLDCALIGVCAVIWSNTVFLSKCEVRV